MVEEIKLDLKKAYTVTYLFLDSLWDDPKGKLSDKEKDDFGGLIGIIYSSSADWSATLEKYYGSHIPAESDPISSKECLNLFQVFLHIVCVEFELGCLFLLDIAKGLEADSPKYAKEKELWKKALADASVGKVKNS